MIVRPATPADILAMKAVEVHAATAAHWTAENYERIFSSSALPRLALVVEDSGIVAGFVVAFCSGPDWEIENIAVAEDKRRCGWGARLVSEVLNRALTAGAATVFLEVRESNLPARAMYEKRGFVRSGLRRDYYTNPDEDAAVYQFCFASAAAKRKVTDCK